MTYNPMTYIKKEKPGSSFVMAMFEHGAVSFRLSATATLADIAERLNDASTLHIGRPVAIDVTFNPVVAGRPQARGNAEFRW